MQNIGNYKIIKSIGKGGMGDVYLVEDPVCQREVALKQIRKELLKHKNIQERFLREARVAACLTHPSIISIYSIDEEKIFYTMPYVEGKTLKAVLASASIHVFLQVCQAIAYAHSKEILHRDLKPENIIVGKFGEVIIIDWGLADSIDVEVKVKKEFTKPGKIVGTLPYMTPERVLGGAASVQTDIYALGVILYQLLTLKFPFKRTTVEHFQKNWKSEKLTPPIEAAPYRDIPIQLNEISVKCLTKGYKNVSEMIKDLQTFIEGKPEWVLSTTLDIHHKKDWAFQENILLAKHIALTQGTQVMEWVNMMISKTSFSENIRLETKAAITGQGVGFLLGMPEAVAGLEEGYCIWLGPEGITLFRSNVEVYHINQPTREAKIVILKMDNHLRLYLDGHLVLNYLSLLPSFGNRIGVLSKDTLFEIDKISIYEGSTNVMVKCLAIPDAFLAKKLYPQALAEYRRISKSFAGRAEGREALFKAGITLLKISFNQAHEEFGKLHGTPSEPLEYLGKSLVYKALKDTIEEAKCLELALRKYPKHPLTPTLVEHIILRLHEASFYNRVDAYHFALICQRFLPEIFSKKEHQAIIDSLTSHWERLPFAADTKTALAFWLGKKLALAEMGASEALKELENPTLPYPEIWKLLEKKEWEKAAKSFAKHSKKELQDDTSPLFYLYGCYLRGSLGEAHALKHFSLVNMTPFPQTAAILAHFLLSKIDSKWKISAFYYEKISLLKQLILYYHCGSDKKKETQFKKELTRVKTSNHS